ncbi:MAG TPA: hypothetical protein VGG72_17660 [Bryobacteraceae bacterium]
MAIARIPWDGKALDVRFFEGSSAAIDLACCARFEAQTIARNRIVMVDLTSAPVIDLTKLVSDPDRVGAALLNQGGPVVVMDEQGKIVERSEVNIHAWFISLSPDEKTVAFVGGRRGGNEWALFVAGFRDQEVRKLMPATPLMDYNVRPRVALEWSPDGRRLLYSAPEGILLLDPQTGKSEKIADGGFAEWSPSGDHITYVSRGGDAILLNLATRQKRQSTQVTKCSDRSNGRLMGHSC